MGLVVAVKREGVLVGWFGKGGLDGCEGNRKSE